VSSGEDGPLLQRIEAFVVAAVSGRRQAPPGHLCQIELLLLLLLWVVVVGAAVCLWSFLQAGQGGGPAAGCSLK
jgi:hypothetical protein